MGRPRRQKAELAIFAIVGRIYKRKKITIKIKRLELYGILSAQGAQRFALDLF